MNTLRATKSDCFTDFKSSKRKRCDACEKITLETENNLMVSSYEIDLISGFKSLKNFCSDDCREKWRQERGSESIKTLLHMSDEKKAESPIIPKKTRQQMNKLEKKLSGLNVNLPENS
jgi:hypothetical protein